MGHPEDDAPRQLFAFRDAQAARRFVFRVARALMDVAILVDDVHVLVIDGCDRSEDWSRRQTLVAQLGRESSERWYDIAATLVRRE